MSHRKELARNFQSREIIDDVVRYMWAIANAIFNNFSVLTIAMFVIVAFCKVSG